MKYDVIIIGAGVAGLTIAHELKNSKLKVLVIEAQDYIGGRVRTSLEFGGPVELGAEFVHGKNVATWRYLSEMNVEAVTAGGKKKLLDRSGKPVTKAQTALFYRVLEDLKSKGQDGVSVAEVTRQILGSNHSVVENLVNHSVGDYEAGDADSLDSGAFSDMEKLTDDNGPNFVLTGGYKQLIDYLAKDVTIINNTTVSHIDYSKNLVTIETAVGEAFKAKCVVVTVSLGVLKHKDIDFYPKLPQAKRAAIKKLGMGNVFKLIIKFKTAKRAGEFFHVADGENETNQLISCWWQSKSNPKVLIGYAGGSRHDAVVAMDDAKLWHYVLKDLERITGEKVDSDITDYRLIRWDENKFTRGAYSNHPVGVAMNERSVLAESVDDRIFFAGEATVTSGNYATVHGAIESGWITVSQIDQLFKQ